MAGESEPEPARASAGTSIHLEVGGRVQGVGFRWFIREEARRLGLAGWVRNRPDGSVELAARGEAASVERFARSARAGPPGARVMSVRDLPTDGLEELPSPFTILR
jgi:acylphosphatase